MAAVLFITGGRLIKVFEAKVIVVGLKELDSKLWKGRNHPVHC